MLGNEEVHEHEYGEGTYPPTWRTTWRRMSWGAIFAGLFVTLAIFLTLQILGAGIGLSTINLTGRQTSSASGLGTGAAIWTFVIGLISLFIGGWVAGRFAVQPNWIERVLHGLTVWAFFYIVMFWVVTTALSGLAGGGLALLGGSVSAAGQVASSPQGQQVLQSQGLTPDAIQQEIAKLTGGSTAQQGQQGGVNLVGAVSNYLQSPRTLQDRQQLAQVIAQNTGKSPAEVNQTISNLEQKAQQAKQTTEQVANVTGATFIGLAISMIIGAIVAMLGSLAASAPAVPTHEYERAAGARAGAGTYVSR